MKNSIIIIKTKTNCLRKYRKTRGLNQREAASILGLHSTSVLSRWEHGQSLPTTLNILKLAAMYRTMVEGLYIDLAHEIKEEVLEQEEKVLHHH